MNNIEKRLRSMPENNIEKMLMRLPVVSDWIDYKGERIFATINIQATQKAKKPMLDIHYCATQALNNNVLKTVQYDKSKFKKI